MFCKNCGTQLDDNAQYCYKCGALTENAPAQGAQPAQPAQPVAPAPAPVADPTPVPPVAPAQQPVAPVTPATGQAPVPPTPVAPATPVTPTAAPATPDAGNKKKKVLIIVGVVAAIIILLIILVACLGGNDDSSSSSTDTNTTVATDSETTNETTYTSSNNSTSGFVFINSDAGDSSKEENQTNPVIDVDAMHTATNEQTFDLAITDVEGIKDGYSGTLSGDIAAGQDAVSISIQNNTGEDITNFKVLIAAYNYGNHIVKMSSDVSLDAFDMDNTDAMRIYNNLTVYSLADDTTISDGQTQKMSIRCDLSEFEGFDVIVESYTTADGKEHVNDKEEDWIYTVCGVN